MEVLYEIMNWIVGEHRNPISWESILKELGLLFIIFGIIAAFVYHFTNTRNLNSGKQNMYFLKVAGLFLLLLWTFSAIRLFGSIGEFVDFSNYLALVLKSSVALFATFYLASYYIIRYFSNTRKKYVPTILTRFLRPKKQK